MRTLMTQILCEHKAPLQVQLNSGYYLYIGDSHNVNSSQVEMKVLSQTNLFYILSCY